MSVNITVSGKFTKNCLGNPLADPQRVKKELEDERRKKRIKQVRVQSSNLARKIRDDVAEEKARQLRRLEEMKSQELNCWREHVLASKNADFRTAVFQVGKAHCAAKAENEYMAQVQPESYKDFRKKLKARRSGDNASHAEKKLLKNSCTQTPQANCTQTGVKGAEIRTTKRKRVVCSAGRTCCCCSCDSTSEDLKCNDYDSDINMQVKNTACSDDEETISDETMPLDEEESDQNITVIPARMEMEINEEVVVEDVGTDTSEHSFPRTTRPAPQKSAERQSQRDMSKCLPPRTQSPPKALPAQENQIATKPQSPPKTSSAPAQRKPMQPRTQSPSKSMPAAALNRPMTRRTQSPPKAMPARTKSAPATAKSLPAQNKPKPAQRKPQSVQHKPQSASTRPQQNTQAQQISPKKSKPYSPHKYEAPAPERGADDKRYSQLTSYFARIEGQQHAAVKDAEAPTQEKIPLSPPKVKQLTVCRCCLDCALPLRGQTVSTTTVTLCRCHKAGNIDQRPSCSQDAPVQYYDYNNKFSKEYPQPSQSVHVVREHPMAMNANEQASIEQRLQATSGEDAEQLRKRADERGKRALEREAVRRDCVDLTEKLELLLQKHPQLLPSDAGLVQRHRAANAAVRKETKMNSAVEEILMRPAVITCPEVQAPSKSVDRNRPATRRIPQEINVGSPPNSASMSDTCSSILLGYVNDQSKQIRNELDACEPERSQGKEEQLKRLLQRTEQLRETLLQEIRSGGPSSSSDGEKVQQVLDSISKLRTERESISHGAAKGAEIPDSASEKQLKINGKLLEQKIREFCEMQSAANKEDSSGLQRTKSSDKPIEIVIKVKGEICAQKRQATRAKVVKGTKKPQSPSKIKQQTKAIEHSESTEQQQAIEQQLAIEQGQFASQQRAGNQQRAAQPEKPANQKTADQQQPSPSSSSQTQTTFNSDSTHYRSLPLRIKSVTAAKENEESLRKQDENTREEFMNEETAMYSGDSVAVEVERPESRPVNPLLAQYIQRLLGMTRESINTLDMSSSDIETPTTSIINASANMLDASSEDRLTHVKQFIDENRVFVTELEKSLQSAKANNETARAIDQIWKQRLLNSSRSSKTETQKQETVFKAPKGQAPKAKPAEKRIGVTTAKKPDTSKRQSTSAVQHKGRVATPAYRSAQQKAPTAIHARSISTPVTSREKGDRRRKPPQQLIQEAEEMETQYDQMSENCTHRIAKLTDLISQVRAEKQRLLEMTLSSVSSTDYHDLPENKSGAKCEAESPATSSSDSRLLDSNLINEMATLSGENQTPECTLLEKHKATGKSQDSGISMSRPVTAQEQHYDFEPPSYASSNTQSTSQRRQKPPATIRRFSPQLAEEDFAHELSTIMEVETPCNSRIQPGTSRGQASSTRTDTQSSHCGYTEDTSYMKQVPSSPSRADAVRFAAEVSRQRGLPDASRRADESSYRQQRPRSPGADTRQADASPQTTRQRSPPKTTRRADATGYREERARSPALKSGPPSRQADCSCISAPRSASCKDQRPVSPSDASIQRPCQADMSRLAAERRQKREFANTSRKTDSAGGQGRTSPQCVTFDPMEYAASSSRNANTLGQQTSSASADCTCGPQADFMPIQHPTVFPTFEQYTCDMNLDLTQLDANQSLRLKHEYEELMKLVQEVQVIAAPNFEPFPSLTAYLQNMTHSDIIIDSCGLFNGHTSDSVEDLIKSMRQLNQSIKGFPTPKSYRQQNQRTQSSEDDLIDTNSLENLTTAPDSSDSNTMNIEKELQRRKLLTRPFPEAKARARIFASTARDDSPESRCFADLTTESGIDPLTSTGTNSSQANRRGHDIGMNDWLGVMRQTSQGCASLAPHVNSTVAPELSSYYGNCSTDEPEVRNAYAGHLQQRQQPGTCGHYVNRMHSTSRSGHHSHQDPLPQQSRCDPQQGMNLRDFLTKELLRHANSPGTGNSSNTEDSLRSQFFHSIIGFLTPTGSPPTHGNHSTSRKKTSTPVCSSSSPSRTRSGRPQHYSGPSSTTHLFSGESQMSSVHCEDPEWECRRDFRSC